MEPSRSTAGRRLRALRALARDLDAELGPDRSRTVWFWEDDWTIRRVTRSDDQYREGVLLHHCLRRLGVGERDANCLSLRDPENLPHETFAAWAVTLGRDFSFIAASAYSDRFLVAPQRLLLLNNPRLKPAHCGRLLDFAEAAEVPAPRLPTKFGPMAEMIGAALAPAAAVDYARLPVHPSDIIARATIVAARGR